MWSHKEYGGGFRNDKNPKGLTMLEPDLTVTVTPTTLEGYTPHEREELESIINAARLGRQERVESEDPLD
jgi:hypothetical protein